MLNRFIKLTTDGVWVEADPGHVLFLFEDFGLLDWSQALATRVESDGYSRMTIRVENAGVTGYRSFFAEGYISSRTVQHAGKLSNKISKPSKSDCEALKRL